MFCPNCGNQIPETAIFCANCGTSLKNPQPSQNKASAPSVNKKKKFNPLFIILPIVAVFLVILIIAAIVVIGYLLFPKNESVYIPAEPSEVITEIATEYIPEYTAVSTYEVVRSDATWHDASRTASFYGGKLISINDEDEFRNACALADEEGIKVFWIGATRNVYDSWDESKWLDGSDIDYTNWLTGEPTYVSEEEEDELYLMVFKVGSDWYYNDAISDVSSYYTGKMGYIIEYTEYIEK